QRVQVRDNRHPADQLGDKTIFLKIMRGDVLQHVFLIMPAIKLGFFKPYGLGLKPLFNYGDNAVKSAPANKENVLGIYSYHVLLRMLAPSLRRHIYRAAFQ